MNIHEAITHLFNTEGNKVAMVENDYIRDGVIFSGRLPGCAELLLWVKYDDMPHPVPFTMCSSMTSVTFIQVS